MEHKKNFLKIEKNVWHLFLAAFAGLILPLSFAPFGYYWVAEISLVFLLISWFKSSCRRSFWSGWLFGAAFFGGGVYWVYNSVRYYGNAPVILSVAIVVILVAFLALYPALLGYLLNRFYPKNSCYKFLLAFPLGWVILEWIRGWLLSGFPWLYLGYGHVDSTLGGWATIFGVYGVSFVIAETAGAIFCIFLYRKHKWLLFGLIALVATLWTAGAIFINFGQVKHEREISISLIQGNIPQERKWREGELLPILNVYIKATTQNFSSKIIVWPEAAIPTFPKDVAIHLKRLTKTAKLRDTTILSGVPFYDATEDSYYNGIIAFGASDGRYYKRHLLPFGEYMPFEGILSWLRQFIIIPMSNFSSGYKNQPGLFAADTLIAPFVCYEIAYPYLVLDYLPKAGLLVTVSDDSWFGKSTAAAQHLEVARMRSLETGRYQLFSTNTGITAIIDDKGKVVASLPIFQEGVLNADVVLVSGSTFWVGYGQYIWFVLAVFGLIVVQRKYKCS